ncbi:MAG TPA: hypothetical protein VIL35_17765 [Vicinamibacterales bacterium]
MRITRVGAVSVAKISGLLYALGGLIIGAMFALISIAGGAASMAADEPDAMAGGWLFGMGIGAIIVFPVFYGLIGAIGGLIGAWLYNLVAGVIGGVEIELTQ